MRLPDKLKKDLKKHSSVQVTESIKKFVPGSTNIYGVKNPVLNELAVKYKNGGFQLIENLWRSGAFEEKILAAKMIRKVCMNDPEHAIQLVERFANDIDNWALCDTLGMQSLKPINKKYAKEIFALANKFSTSKNIWLKRLSMVIVEDFTKDKNYHHQILMLIEKQKKEKEYYIKKAVAWMERNLSKGR